MNDYFIGENDIARKGSKPYIGINDVAENVLKGYIGVNNIARLFYVKQPASALFWLGDECTSITGGWEVLAMPTTEKTNRNVNYNASAPTKYSGQEHNDSGSLFSSPKVIEAYKWSNRTPYSGGIKTANKIDLSNYNTIYVICDLLYTDGTDNFVNKWKLVAFGDGVTDYNNIPLKEVIYQNPTNDHWIYTYNDYTGLSKFNRVQKIDIPSGITSPVYVGLQLLTNASMTVHHSIALKAMWLSNERKMTTIYKEGVVINPIVHTLNAPDGYVNTGMGSVTNSNYRLNYITGYFGYPSYALQSVINTGITVNQGDSVTIGLNWDGNNYVTEEETNISPMNGTLYAVFNVWVAYNNFRGVSIQLLFSDDEWMPSRDKRLYIKYYENPSFDGIIKEFYIVK